MSFISSKIEPSKNSASEKRTFESMSVLSKRRRDNKNFCSKIISGTNRFLWLFCGLPLLLCQDIYRQADVVSTYWSSLLLESGNNVFLRHCLFIKFCQQEIVWFLVCLTNVDKLLIQFFWFIRVGFAALHVGATSWAVWDFNHCSSTENGPSTQCPFLLQNEAQNNFYNLRLVSWLIQSYVRIKITPTLFCQDSD